MESKEQQRRFLPRERMDLLLDALRCAGYQCLGPVVRDGAIQFRPVGAAADFATGWRDEQGPGHYRLIQDGSRYFAFCNGPQALKPLTFTPDEILWNAQRDESGVLTFSPVEQEPQRLAVIGVRGCDLAALAMQDRHFAEDERYQARRHTLLLIGVDCANSAATCFCTSTGDGPGLRAGYDIGLSELESGWLIWGAGQAAEEILAGLALEKASEMQQGEAVRNLETAAKQQQRTLPGGGLSVLLTSKLDHPVWAEVAQRCLACGNCTAVCPSCFCHSISSHLSLNGVKSQQMRQWDSCFNQDHSIMHGHAVRDSIQLRYRQWMSHKLAGWFAQFGRSGCVGCGRCISWCPVGIDITQVAAAIVEEQL